MKASLRRVFRIFYISFFLLLLIAILALIIITPADAIQQALWNKQPYNVFVIAGCYFLTIVFSGLIWTTRWWSNKQALKAIPKTYVPVEKGDVTKKVRKMIVASLNRSATIGWDARPRMEHEPSALVSTADNRDAFALPNDEDANEQPSKRQSELEKREHAVTIPPRQPVWGNISHHGWSSPASEDLPNLQFITVILELPHLIEARAVSLAPADPESSADPPLPDIRAVDLLQRPASMGLRDYVGHLVGIGVISTPEIAMEFLEGYEYARFSERPLSEVQFRDLMKKFADILREMNHLSPAILDELDMEDAESYIDGDATSATTPSSNRSRSVASLRSAASMSAIGRSPSGRGATSEMSRRGPTFNSALGAPVTPQSRTQAVSNSPDSPLFAQSRQIYAPSIGSSQASFRSQSDGSVIRLGHSNEEADLPYTLSISPQ